MAKKNNNTRHINPYITLTGSAKTIAAFDEAIRKKATSKPKAKDADKQEKG